jgi:hypothetical protein
MAVALEQGLAVGEGEGADRREAARPGVGDGGVLVWGALGMAVGAEVVVAIVGGDADDPVDRAAVGLGERADRADLPGIEDGTPGVSGGHRYVSVGVDSTVYVR